MSLFEGGGVVYIVSSDSLALPVAKDFGQGVVSGLLRRERRGKRCRVLYAAHWGAVA